MAVSLLKNERGHEIRILHPCGNTSLIKKFKEKRENLSKNRSIVQSLLRVHGIIQNQDP